MENMVTNRWWFCLQQKKARKVKTAEIKMAARQRTKTTKKKANNNMEKSRAANSFRLKM